VFALVGILLDGTLYQMWELNAEKKNTQQKIQETQQSIKKLQKQIQMAHDPKFIEREARDRFDLVNKDDVVFVFSNEN
jgi:cell division protein FtsB